MIFTRPGGYESRKETMYAVYRKYRTEKKAKRDGLLTDDLERAKDIAHREKASWGGQNGVYEWIRVRDLETRKYVYEA